MSTAKKTSKTKKSPAEKAVKSVLKQVKAERGVVERKLPQEKALVRELKAGTPAQNQTGRFFRRNFTKRDAARLAWMLCVADPFGSKGVPVPATLTPGASMSCPRIYVAPFKSFASTNASGTCFIGLNADGWLPNPSAAVGTPPVPMNMYLGNSTANSGTRGWPLHFTTSTYAGSGTTGATGLSYPAPSTTQAAVVTGMGFMQLPDNFIGAQLNGNPASGNAFQRYQCVAAGLRARPTAPPNGALVMAGVMLAVQQTLGDTVITNPSAASGTTAVGGANCYGYISGLTNSSQGGTVSTAVSPLGPDSVGLEEWDMAAWPSSNKEKDWLELSAIPNQSCSFGQWTPGQTGANVVGYPQLAIVVAGAQSGQLIEFEGKLIYAWYGSVSYEENAAQLALNVPSEDLASTVSDGKAHLSISNRSLTPKRAAVQAMVQPTIEDGGVHAKNAAEWINSGKDVIESVTGSSIGDLIGEGLGFLAGALL